MSNVDDPRRVDGDTGTTLMRILLSGKIQLTFVFAAFIAALAVPESAIAKVHAVSTDGEATVYLARDFTRDFDVSYSVQFFRTPQNRSWAFVSLLLLGRTAESGSLGVGLSRGPGHEAALTGFTDATKPQVAPIYRTTRLRCRLECTIELRGTPSTVSALIDNRLTGTWQRKPLGLVKPYIQINGEVTAIGDHIFARLRPLHARISVHRFPAPMCAFTTQGVRAYATNNGEVMFKGSRDPHAGATYVSLLTGATGDTCRDATGKHPRPLLK